MDDCPNSYQLVVVQIDASRKASREHAAEGQLVDQVFERAHLLDHGDLLEKVIEGKVTAQHPRGVFFGLLFVDDLFEVLHEADDVAHTKNAAGHAVGTETFELVEGLANAAKQNGRSRHLADAQGGAAACIAVELRENHARDVEQFVEVFCCLNRVLTDHRVDDQVDILRVDRAFDGFELAHELFVDGEASGRIVDDQVAALLLGFGLGSGADVDGSFARDVENRNAKLLAQDLKLFNRCGALHIGCNEKGLARFGFA